jgi:hypothetical protein
VRARNIKPATFTNELLAFAAPIHTVIFAGLWCIADRRGVLSDLPKQIHMLINPGRNLASTRNSLAWLEENGFIARYTVGNYQLIKILAFTKHQNPHRDEKESDLPDYGASTVPAQGNGMVPAPGKPEPLGLIPSSLIPDSGSLIPDSPHTGTPGRNGVAPPGSSGGRVGGNRKRREEPESEWKPPTEEQIRAGE